MKQKVLYQPLWPCANIVLQLNEQFYGLTEVGWPTKGIRNSVAC